MNVSGQIINRVKVGGTPFSVKQLKKGKCLLVGCGDGHHWVEIDAKTWKIGRLVTSGDLEGLSLLFVAELSAIGMGRRCFVIGTDTARTNLNRNLWK